MRNRLARVVLGGAVAALLSAPLTAPSHAWSCQDEVGYAACLVVGTTCRTAIELGLRGDLCTFG
jgi:hypothetical protein